MNKTTILVILLSMIGVLVGASGAKGSGAADSAGVLTAEWTGRALGVGELREPLGLAVDDRGFIFVADAMAGKVYRYYPDGASVEVDQPELNAGFYPIDIAAHGTFIYVLDYAGNRIIRFDYKGAWLDILLDFSQFERMRPASLTTSFAGRLLTTDMESHDLTVWSPLLDVEIRTGEYGWADGSFDKPTKAALIGEERIAVTEFGNSRVQILSSSGRFEGYAVPGDSISPGAPRYLCSSPDGHLFVAYTESGYVCVFNPSLDHVLTIGGVGNDINPSAVAVSWSDLLYIADLKTRSILVYRLNYPGK